MILTIETHNYMENNGYFTETRRTGKKVLTCAVAVAGSIVTTVGAVTITTGFGLGVFLVGKAISTVGIIICAQ